MRVKQRAHWAVHQAIKEGKLIRKPCGVCGNMAGQAHHEDYNQPLEVVWLCCSCHRALHWSRIFAAREMAAEQAKLALDTTLPIYSTEFFLWTYLMRQEYYSMDRFAESVGCPLQELYAIKDGKQGATASFQRHCEEVLCVPRSVLFASVKEDAA